MADIYEAMKVKTGVARSLRAYNTALIPRATEALTRQQWKIWLHGYIEERTHQFQCALLQTAMNNDVIPLAAPVSAI